MPQTEHCLMIGGPKHGEFMEVIKNDAVHKVIVPPPAGQPATQPERRPLFGPFPTAYEIHQYTRRPLTFADPTTGKRYEQSVYVHETITTMDVAEQALMAALLCNYMRAGVEVG